LYLQCPINPLTCWKIFLPLSSSISYTASIPCSNPQMYHMGRIANNLERSSKSKSVEKIKHADIPWLRWS
jgi:hypothetical protein